MMVVYLEYISKMHVSAMIILISLVSMRKCENYFASAFANKPNNLCSVTERIELGCSRTEPNAHNLIQCSVICNSDKTCMGVSMDENDNCYIHTRCRKLSRCSNDNNQHRYWSRCEHGREWHASSESCKCDNGCRGAKCDQGFSKCIDLKEEGYDADNFYRIFLDPEQDGDDLLRVFCQFKPSYYTNNPLSVFRNQGRKDFNKTWDDYVHGFYYDNFHFWIGLETWRKLIKSDCGPLNNTKIGFYPSLRKGKMIKRSYYGFTLSDSSQGYKIDFRSSFASKMYHVGRYFAFADCFPKNTRFSTWDNDRDGMKKENCASRDGSGWWYDNSCDKPCNVMGFGFDYFGSKSRYQLFSAADIDMSWDEINTSDDAMFEITQMC